MYCKVFYHFLFKNTNVKKISVSFDFFPFKLGLISSTVSENILPQDPGNSNNV